VLKVKAKSTKFTWHTKYVTNSSPQEGQALYMITVVHLYLSKGFIVQITQKSKFDHSLKKFIFNHHVTYDVDNWYIGWPKKELQLVLLIPVARRTCQLHWIRKHRDKRFTFSCTLYIPKMNDPLDIAGGVEIQYL